MPLPLLGTSIRMQKDSEQQEKLQQRYFKTSSFSSSDEDNNKMRNSSQTYWKKSDDYQYMENTTGKRIDDEAKIYQQKLYVSPQVSNTWKIKTTSKGIWPSMMKQLKKFNKLVIKDMVKAEEDSTMAEVDAVKNFFLGTPRFHSQQKPGETNNSNQTLASQ
ncbi:unnamed protein product [Rhizopus stolonifer]